MAQASLLLWNQHINFDNDNVDIIDLIYSNFVVYFGGEFPPVIVIDCMKGKE